MIEVLFTGLILDVIQFLLAGGAVWGSIRFLDRTSGNRFTNAYSKILTDPFALAVYHGLRLLAAAILFGAVVG